MNESVANIINAFPKKLSYIEYSDGFRPSFTLTYINQYGYSLEVSIVEGGVFYLSYKTDSSLNRYVYTEQEVIWAIADWMV